MTQHWLKPHWDPGLIISELPMDHFEKNGIKALILDVDGTILQGKKIKLHHTIKDWVLKAKESLFIHIFSNNPSTERISSVANQLGLQYTCGGGKPGRKKLMKVIKQLDFNHESIAIVGDRIFTDVLVGNRLGLYTVLVHPLEKNGGPKQTNRVQIFEKKLANFLGA